ncbi:MAG TPA: DegT/DnrJ/EryC1/StrS family aminotransferase [Patescibacteria group bacterium]|nr:DegT/DnrJ/EryC1/StrS family aminotransferase [Patescibacteria group bacterium]
MIKLFNIPTYILDTSSYNHVLNGSIVTEFEQAFCEYVGIKYGCAFDSETSIIQAIFHNANSTIYLPSMLPPVVANAIVLGGNKLFFSNNINWIGRSYPLHVFNDGRTLIDSAQEVFRHCCDYMNDTDVILFSFYPTKPLSGIDGGMMCSNNKDVIDCYRRLSMNGMDNNVNSWDRRVIEPGWKTYMRSVQADVALRNLRNLDARNDQVNEIREKYNKAFELNNRSLHLYRIRVECNEYLVKNAGIQCGIHYKPLHTMPVYGLHRADLDDIRMCKHNPLFNVEWESRHTLSIPLHEALTDAEVDRVIEFFKPLIWRE